MKTILTPLKIVLLYAITGGLWILFSDTALMAIVKNPEAFTRVAIIKGWVYVIVTAYLLYWLISRYAYERRKKEEEFAGVFERITDAFVALDTDWRYTYVNKKAAEIFGRRPEDMVGRHIWTEFPEGIDHPFYKAYHRAMQGQTPIFLEEYYPPYDRWFENRIYPSKDGLSIYFTDITERKQAEERISRLTRLYSVLSKINEAIVRTDEPEELYMHACRIIVEEGGFRMAWIGIVNSETLFVEPVAVCGHEDGYLHEKRISIDEKVPEGRGPTGTAMRTGGYFICNDIENDPVMAPWREEALKRGYRSSAAFALKSGTQMIGTLNIYSSVAHFFQEEKEEEVRLLKALSEDISYAIESMEIERLRIKAEQELQMLTIELEDRVKQRTAELKDSQRVLMGLVEDLNQKTEELKSANERLTELDRLKSMFIASMSHELRTPLNSIIGFTGIILQGMAGEINEEQRDQLQRVSKAGKHLLSLITDIIDISKIEAGKIEAYAEEFALEGVLKDAVSNLKLQIKEKGLELEVSMVPQKIIVKTDRKRLFQCVLNYLSNAVKFTEKGKIILTAKEKGDMIEIEVTDTGIGIKEEDLPLLFQSFVRLRSPLKMATAGTGLGLYLTRKLVTEVLDGEVSVTSSYGKGSAFGLKIPKDLKENKK